MKMHKRGNNYFVWEELLGKVSKFSRNVEPGMGGSTLLSLSGHSDVTYALPFILL